MTVALATAREASPAPVIDDGGFQNVCRRRQHRPYNTKPFSATIESKTFKGDEELYGSTAPYCRKKNQSSQTSTIPQAAFPWIRRPQRTFWNKLIPQLQNGSTKQVSRPLKSDFKPIGWADPSTTPSSYL